VDNVDGGMKHALDVLVPALTTSAVGAFFFLELPIMDIHSVVSILFA